MADVIEVNCTTGEVITRPQTDEEIAATKAAAAQAEADAKAKADADAAIAKAKASAQAKLTALGLTADEVAALVG